MSKKLLQIAEQRKRLIAEAAAQRATIADNIGAWRKPFFLADKGLQAMRYMKSHPAWLIGGGVALIMLKPRRVMKWLKLGWASWTLLRRIR